MITCQKFLIRGMDCANESRAIQAALDALPGVAAVRFDLVRGHADVDFDQLQTTPIAIQQAIRRAGFFSELEGFSSSRDERETRKRLWFVAAAGLTFLAGASLVVLPGFSDAWLKQEWAGKGLLGVSVLLSARFFAARAWVALRQRHADMNVLVVVATLGAFVLGDWVEGASVSFLFAVANLLESWSAQRVRKSIEGFLDLTPQTAERIDESAGLASAIDVAAIRAGDLLLVRPAARIPADGSVEEGRSSVDQSALTGEAIPWDVEPGMQVLAGSTNGDGTLSVRAATDATDSRAARVKEAISRAQSLRSATESWVDKFSRVYTPLVLLTAILVAAVPALLGYDAREWFYNALVVVLIACPCALVISTPVTIVSAVTALARGGVFMRGGASIERAARIRAVAFDKTGVLTEGQLRVAEVRPVSGVDAEAALQAVGALERMSEHPIARAISSFVDRLDESSPAVRESAKDYRAIPGQGGEGEVRGMPVWVGRPALAKAKGAWDAHFEATAADMMSSGATVVCAGSCDRLWVMFSLSDAPRAGASRAVDELREMGIERLAMLTGDHFEAARRVAERVGLTEFRAGLLPEEKLAALREMEAALGQVAMVGDGMNDAPAMAAASFSIASGERATNAAVEAADAVIWSGDLRRVPWMLRHTRRAMGIVRQNVAIAVGSKLAFVLLASLGMATLWMAVLADVGATLLVTFNGLRMLRPAQTPAMETSDSLVPIKTSS